MCGFEKERKKEKECVCVFVCEKDKKGTKKEVATGKEEEREGGRDVKVSQSPMGLLALK